VAMTLLFAHQKGAGPGVFLHRAALLPANARPLSSRANSP
jgi:hypothetical protein